MKILTVKGNGEFTAGPKAPSDIIQILKQQYNAESILLFPAKNIFEKIIYRLKIFFTIINTKIKKEVLIIQFPMYESTNLLNKLFLFSLKFINKEKTIVLIHDLDSIRTENEVLKEQEISRLKKVKHIIAHNQKMISYLKKLGIEANFYNLEVFDYLCDNKNYEKQNNKFDKNNFTVIYAGNLSQEKSPYLYQIEEKKLNFKINLYGIGIEKDINLKLKYKGKFSPNELPDNLNGDLGLVWDGKFDESDENVGYKKYTKYNNPHKFSCYVAAGIPVIVWEKSAIADFVKKYNIGYTIKSIYDINSLDFSDYETKRENVSKVQEKVRNGFFTKRVIQGCLER